MFCNGTVAHFRDIPDTSIVMCAADGRRRSACGHGADSNEAVAEHRMSAAHKDSAGACGRFAENAALQGADIGTRDCAYPQSWARHGNMFLLSSNPYHFMPPLLVGARP